MNIMINAGCGEKLLPGWINVDNYENFVGCRDKFDDTFKVVTPKTLHTVNPNPSVCYCMCWDLNSFPYPFPDGYARKILLSHVLEHLDDPYKVLLECDRVLKNQGRLVVELPTFANSIVHKRWVNNLDCMDILFRFKKVREYHGFNYRLENIKHTRFVLWTRNRIRKRFIRLLSWILSIAFSGRKWTLIKEDTE